MLEHCRRKTTGILHEKETKASVAVFHFIFCYNFWHTYICGRSRIIDRGNMMML